eukprot:2719842-Rhodomonas_salina.5
MYQVLTEHDQATSDLQTCDAATPQSCRAREVREEGSSSREEKRSRGEDAVEAHRTGRMGGGRS